MFSFIKDTFSNFSDGVISAYKDNAAVIEGIGKKRFFADQKSKKYSFIDEEEIPWDILAFPWVNSCLKNFFADLKSGNFILRTEDIIRR